jgi:hypothetical protein
MLPAAPEPTAPRARRRALLAFGTALSRRGPLAAISLGIGALTILGAIAATLAVARRGENAPLEQMPGMTAGALGWGAGVLLAFAAAAHALRRDREDGMTALLRARGASIAGYVWTRVGGLTLLLAAVCVGGTLVAGVVATLAATRVGLVLRTLQGTGAALAYAVAFCATLGPLAMAALGARSRAGGYLFLLAVLVLPELLSPLTSSIVPDGWRDLTSIPDALHALRASLMPRGADPWRATKAVFVLALVVAACLALVRRAAAAAQAEEAP